MNIVEVEPGVYSVIHDGASYEVRVVASEFTIEGHSWVIERGDPRQWKRPGAAAASGGRASIAAPMPGRIVRVLVAVGDEVTAGQGIVVVEAMKMQNELKSPRDGRVVSLQAKEQDSVTAGAVLAIVG